MGRSATAPFIRQSKACGSPHRIFSNAIGRSRPRFANSDSTTRRQGNAQSSHCVHWSCPQPSGSGHQVRALPTRSSGATTRLIPTKRLASPRQTRRLESRMRKARRQVHATPPEHEDVWEETVGKAPPADNDPWTFASFKHAMWQWLNFDDAPEYFSANDLADDGLPRMKHLG